MSKRYASTAVMLCLSMILSAISYGAITHRFAFSQVIQPNDISANGNAAYSAKVLPARFPGLIVESDTPSNQTVSRLQVLRMAARLALLMPYMIKFKIRAEAYTRIGEIGLSFSERQQ